MPCQRCEQLVQGCALAFVESGGDPALVLTGERRNLLQQPFSRCGEVQRV